MSGYKLDTVSGVSQFTISFLIRCNWQSIQTFEIGHFHNFWTSMTLTLDRVIDIPSCVTHRLLPTYQILFKSEQIFVNGWTDERTYVHMDAHRQ